MDNLALVIDTENHTGVTRSREPSLPSHSLFRSGTITYSTENAESSQNPTNDHDDQFCSPTTVLSSGYGNTSCSQLGIPHPVIKHSFDESKGGFVVGSVDAYPPSDRSHFCLLSPKDVPLVRPPSFYSVAESEHPNNWPAHVTPLTPMRFASANVSTTSTAFPWQPPQLQLPPSSDPKRNKYNPRSPRFNRLRRQSKVVTVEGVDYGSGKAHPRNGGGGSGFSLSLSPPTATAVLPMAARRVSFASTTNNNGGDEFRSPPYFAGGGGANSSLASNAFIMNSGEVGNVFMLDTSTYTATSTPLVAQPHPIANLFEQLSPSMSSAHAWVRECNPHMLRQKVNDSFATTTTVTEVHGVIPIFSSNPLDLAPEQNILFGTQSDVCAEEGDYSLSSEDCLHFVYDGTL